MQVRAPASLNAYLRNADYVLCAMARSRGLADRRSRLSMVSSSASFEIPALLRLPCLARQTSPAAHGIPRGVGHEPLFGGTTKYKPKVEALLGESIGTAAADIQHR
jgi:hypothetical protein